MIYALCILPRAEKELSALDSKPYEAVKKKIYSLRDEPRRVAGSLQIIQAGESRWKLSGRLRNK